MLGWLWLRAGFGRRLGEPRWQAAHLRLLRLDPGPGLRHRPRARSGCGSSAPARVSRCRGTGRCWCSAGTPGRATRCCSIRALVSLAGLRPRIVLKDALQLDPTVDVLLNRLPNRFVTPRPGVAEDVESAIASLASDAGPGDAVVIFPEGGNFSERRRVRAIERLRSLGHDDEAAKAERMRHLMAPKPGGTLAAMAAAPDADVLLVAHEGLEDLSSLGDLWSGLPMDDVVDVALVAGAVRRAAPGPGRRRSGGLALRLVGPARRLGGRAPGRRRPLSGPAGRRRAQMSPLNVSQELGLPDL